MPGAAIYPSLKAKSVFVTGGATGIGASLVKNFAGQGAQVGFIDIDQQAGLGLITELDDISSFKPWFSHVDVRDVSSLRDAIKSFCEHSGSVDVLINNVANDTRHQPLEVTEANWRDCMAVNLDSAFFAAQTAIPIMQRAGGGSIINFSSINALTGPSEMPGYVSAKAAVLGLTKALARNYGPDGIRVNAILPGWVVTEKQLVKWLTPEIEREWMKHTALKQRILPDDVAKLALFLASDDSLMITNQQFIIDGGHI